MIQAWRPPQPDVDLAYTVAMVPSGAYVSVPDGRCGLVWADSHVWWLGPATRPWRTPRRISGVVGVRLAHLSGRRFAGQPLSRWSDTRTRLSDLTGQADAADLEHLLARTLNDVARIAVLLDYAASRTRQPPPLPDAARMFTAMSDGLSVSVFAHQAGLSVRQVHRRSLDAFGMAPATLRQVLRLHNAAAVHQSSPRPSLAQTAATAGYSDQAHLARECRRLTLTPAASALAAPGMASDPFKTPPDQATYVHDHDFMG